MAKFPYIERDVSWLYFNERVLQEAKDPSVPLYERLKFLAIFSSNLDEYYRVRVSSLRSFKQLKKKTRRQLDVKPKKALKKIVRIVQEQQEEFGRIYTQELLPELAKKDIRVLKVADFSEEQQIFAKRFFKEKVFPHIEPIFLVNGNQVSPFLKNKGIYFVVHFSTVDAPMAIVEIPTDAFGRFMQLPSSQGGYAITFLDEIMRLGLDDFFLGLHIEGAYAIKISRDADIYIDNEYSGDLVEKIQQGLEDRAIGLPTRFLYDKTMPEQVLERIKRVFAFTDYDVIEGGRYHNFNDFFSFPDPSDNPELHYQELPPLPHPTLEDTNSILATLRERDVMLHFPYQKYDYVPQLIEEAANDPFVTKIRITLYRVAKGSAVIQALLDALAKGKEVTAFIEVKARFDEESNLTQGTALKAAGAMVKYSYPGVKVHTKLLLIHRKADNQRTSFAYLGTGNFNEKTAKIYSDHALLTSDVRLTEEVERIFQLLLGNMIVPKCKHLLVSPFTSRKGFKKMIATEIANAVAGKEAWMVLKMNSLEDKKMIKELYKASRAGVKIQLIVRGICSLRAGVEGHSENIEVISIVDRFLEHSRVYVFANGGNPRMFTASADWMNRNLDRRVEVVMPIYDRELYTEIWHTLQLQLQDNTKARVLDADNKNAYVPQVAGTTKIQAQLATYQFLKEKLAVNQTS
ncbi:MAG: polyphosphate kinase 1 [Saprospiraceae bacterium]